MKKMLRPDNDIKTAKRNTLHISYFSSNSHEIAILWDN